MGILKAGNFFGGIQDLLFVNHSSQPSQGSKANFLKVNMVGGIFKAEFMQFIFILLVFYFLILAYLALFPY